MVDSRRQGGHLSAMTTEAKPGRTIFPGFHDDLPERLAAAGHAPDAAAALLDLDTEMFSWHRRSMKGEFAGRLIAEMELDLELSQFHALTAISRIEHGVGRLRAEPATVGLLAEEMAIDPSRASRIATGLIEAGWLRREAAQEDGRKSVLLLTDRARAAFRQYRDLKWDKLLHVFADWDEGDIRAFARLFARYSAGMAQVFAGGA
jgi:DNA-binding MarR family transcriptional regulator